jgi:5,10-methylenetetrahydromethanopterin reductase
MSRRRFRDTGNSLVTLGKTVAAETDRRQVGGIGLAVGYDPAATLKEMAAQVADAERAGFVLGMFSETYFTNRDSVSAIATFAHATSRIGLATTQVVRLRSPLLMAQTAATLDELCDGRFTLVLGAATARHSARNGLAPQRPPETPPATLREYLETIRELLSGERVSFDGEVVHLDDVALNWTPRRPGIPLWTAATSRLGLRIAAELADGVLLDGGTSPEYSANAVALVRRYREAAGKTMDGFTIAQLLGVSIADDEASALDAIRWEVASKFRYGITAKSKLEVGEPHVDPGAPDRLASVYRDGGEDALERAIPDEYVRALTASGDDAQVRERVERYRGAGVALPVLRVPDASQLGRLLELAGRAGWATATATSTGAVTHR